MQCRILPKSGIEIEGIGRVLLGLPRDVLERVLVPRFVDSFQKTAADVYVDEPLSVWTFDREDRLFEFSVRSREVDVMWEDLSLLGVSFRRLRRQLVKRGIECCSPDDGGPEFVAVDLGVCFGRHSGRKVEEVIMTLDPSRYIECGSSGVELGLASDMLDELPDDIVPLSSKH